MSVYEYLLRLILYFTDSIIQSNSNFYLFKGIVMAQDSGLITFFDVKTCGFYRIKQVKKNKKKVAVKVNGSLSETINLIANWVKGRDFSQTVPWDTNSSNNKQKIYCKDVYEDENSGEMLFVFCKALNNDKGALSGFIQDAKVGTSEKDVIKIQNKAEGKDLIYGEPMYYWFLPDLNLVVNINFPHSVALTSHISDYFKKCIDNHIKTPGRKATNRTYFNSLSHREMDVKSVNYSSDCGQFSMTYKFNVSLKTLSVHDVSLEVLAKKITHLVVRDTISHSQIVEDNSLFALYNKVRGKQAKLSRTKQVEIISEVHINAEELAAIIEVYNEEQKAVTNWNDVGFRINNEENTRWFDSYIDRKHIYMDDSEKKEGSYYPAEKIFNCLNDQRISLLDFTSSKMAKVFEVSK